MRAFSHLFLLTVCDAEHSLGNTTESPKKALTRCIPLTLDSSASRTLISYYFFINYPCFGFFYNNIKWS